MGYGMYIGKESMRWFILMVEFMLLWKSRYNFYLFDFYEGNSIVSVLILELFGIRIVRKDINVFFEFFNMFFLVVIL